MFWKNNKAAQKSSSAYGIRGFFQQVYGAFTEPVIDTPDCIEPFEGQIDDSANAFQGLISDAATAAQGAITDTVAFQGIINESIPFQGAIDDSANAFNGLIDDSPVGVEGRICP